MNHLTAKLRPEDETRMIRLLLAWMTGDKLALDTVLNEAMKERAGTPGLLFALIDFGARLANESVENPIEQLRASLLRLETASEE